MSRRVRLMNISWGTPGQKVFICIFGLASGLNMNFFWGGALIKAQGEWHFAPCYLSDQDFSI
jgi:hypothetical protein